MTGLCGSQTQQPHHQKYLVVGFTFGRTTQILPANAQDNVPRPFHSGYDAAGPLKPPAACEADKP